MHSGQNILIHTTGLAQVTVLPSAADARPRSVLPTASPRERSSSGTRADSRVLCDKSCLVWDGRQKAARYAFMAGCLSRFRRILSSWMSLCARQNSQHHTEKWKTFVAYRSLKLALNTFAMEASQGWTLSTHWWSAIPSCFGDCLVFRASRCHVHMCESDADAFHYLYPSFCSANLHMVPPFHASQSPRPSQRVHGISVSLQHFISVIPASLMT